MSGTGNHAGEQGAPVEARNLRESIRSRPVDRMNRQRTSVKDCPISAARQNS